MIFECFVFHKPTPNPFKEGNLIQKKIKFVISIDRLVNKSVPDNEVKGILHVNYRLAPSTQLPTPK